MTITREKMKHVRYALRRKYAWPGGYALYLIMADGESLCVTCGRENYRLLVKETARPGFNTGWRVETIDANYEDPRLFCCNCGKRIESAYAEEEVM